MNVMRNLLLFKPKFTRPPSCKNCIYYRNNNNTALHSKETCTIFLYEITDKAAYYLDAEICRKNKGLCGPDGRYFINKD